MKTSQEHTERAMQFVLDNPHLYLAEMERLSGISYVYLNKARKSLGISGIDKVKRFWLSVDIKGENDCWLWQGYVGPKETPYGKFLSFYAHRFSWSISNGEIPKGVFVLHHCDTPVCVNPKHLYIGTAADNARDKIVRGRSNSSLSNNQVHQIRSFYETYKITYKELSALFGVCEVAIHNIVKRKTFKLI